MAMLGLFDLVRSKNFKFSELWFWVNSFNLKAGVEFIELHKVRGQRLVPVGHPLGPWIVFSLDSLPFLAWTKELVT